MLISTMSIFAIRAFEPNCWTSCATFLMDSYCTVEFAGGMKEFKDLFFGKDKS